jgi:hypothetical protein
MKPVGENTQPGQCSFNLFYAKPEHLQPTSVHGEENKNKENE